MRARSRLLDPIRRSRRGRARRAAATSDSRWGRARSAAGALDLWWRWGTRWGWGPGRGRRLDSGGDRREGKRSRAEEMRWRTGSFGLGKDRLSVGPVGPCNRGSAVSDVSNVRALGGGVASLSHRCQVGPRGSRRRRLAWTWAEAQSWLPLVCLGPLSDHAACRQRNRRCFPLPLASIFLRLLLSRRSRPGLIMNS